ncbi:hypothetical protein NDU88_003734 [Pleurodeles waltl]|uniref:Uncharacterized protein n=1 Tax=Pleurodeles waltl TaxID=8319 RepID=A0AAV7TPF4_PLEWA|nr:hypothetical protein NDU88_003734 [Pleurodeles waltl]
MLWLHYEYLPQVASTAYHELGPARIDPRSYRRDAASSEGCRPCRSEKLVTCRTRELRRTPPGAPGAQASIYYAVRHDRGRNKRRSWPAAEDTGRLPRLGCLAKKKVAVREALEDSRPATCVRRPSKNW